MRTVLLAMLVPVLALAGSVTKTIGFDSRDIEMTQANGFDVIRMADFVTTLELGKPMMPQATFHVLVPPTATVTGIEVTPLEPEEIPGTFRVHPVQHPVTVSARTIPGFVEPDAAAYASAAPYPAELVGWDRTGTKSGWRVCPFVLHPLSYVPATGRLTLYRRMQVTVTWAEHDVAPTPQTPSQQQVLGSPVGRLVINPEDLDRFAPPTRLTDDPDVDYAIVTSNALSGLWADLVAWRTRKGWRAEVFTTEWITANYQGRDTQEKIRNFVIDYWTNRGLKWLLLAGDNAIVPGRRCRATVNSSNGNIPADVYYGDLQWSYDGNNNNVFGEAGYDTVDFYYDVYVGRASVDNSSQVNTFISKVLGYELDPTTDYLKKLCLPYVWLWSGYSGRVCNDSIAAQSPAGWTDFYIADPTNTAPMVNAINEGYHFVHPTAHGSATGLYDMNSRLIYSTSSASSQTNSTRPAIVNSIACISGDFETSDCLAEALMNNPTGGAVAVMMNSREGWGTPPVMGPSERIDNKFYDFYFRMDSVDIGVSHAHSKDFYAYQAQSQGVWRWCYWDLNLFGDPNMSLWREDPGYLDASRPDTVETGARNFEFQVTAGGSPVQGALVCLHKDDEVHVAGRTNWNGLVTLTFNPLTPGTMLFTVSASSKYPLQDSIVVVQGAPQPYVDIQAVFVDDSGNNQLDPGETVNLYVTIKNLGGAAATNAAGTLRESSTHITLSDSTASYGTVASGDTSRGDAYVVTASGGTPGGTRIPFTLHVTADEGSWDPAFELVVGAPPSPGEVVMNHDTGYCKLTVTCLGGIGFTEPPSLDLGVGFSYPKSSASHLFYSSLLFGNGPAWLVDRFYSQPASGGVNQDLRIVDSLRPVVPPGSGDEHFRCVMDDGGHPSSKSITVTQHSHQSADPGYDDFVVLAYDITNDGSSAANGIYAGIISDFDIGSAPTTNTAVSNETKRYSFMRQQSNANPCVGMKVLDPPSFANLVAVDHARYVYPDSCVTDGQKYKLLNGEIELRNSNRAYDWSVGVSVGPFDLPVGATQRVAFAYLGGSSEANFDQNADSAQSWYDNNSAVFEPPAPRLPETRGLEAVPNPFTRQVSISCQVPVAGRVRLQVFDITGRELATLHDGAAPAGRLTATWQPGEIANGVYLVKATLPDGTLTEKLMLLR